MSLLTDQAEKAVNELEPVANAGGTVANALHQAILSTETTRQAADVLHGTWLGHPLHPVLTDLAIGAWVTGSLFDAVGSITNDDSVRKSADHAMLAGTAWAIPTAVTGLVEYSTIPQHATALATLHGLLNVINFGLYAASVSARRRGHRAQGVLLSTIGLGLTCISAWLGGELVYKHKVGVDHSDSFEKPSRWQPVIDVRGLGQRQPHRVEVDGKPVLVFRNGDEVYAIGATCAHDGGPLNEGTFKGSCVECPWHQSVFDMGNGRVVHGPATHAQPAFETRIRNNKVEIRVLPTRSQRG